MARIPDALPRIAFTFVFCIRKKCTNGTWSSGSAKDVVDSCPNIPERSWETHLQLMQLEVWSLNSAPHAHGAVVHRVELESDPICIL